MNTITLQTLIETTIKESKGSLSKETSDMFFQMIIEDDEYGLFQPLEDAEGILV